MADNTTELEVLDQIVDVLGGTSGQYETVVPTLQQILTLLGGGGGGGGYNPALSVGRADALTGADETAQWAQRESTGSNAATVRSVQGAAVAWNQMCPAMSDSSWTEMTAPTVTKTVTDEVMTLTYSADKDYGGVRSNKGPKVISGHKYYIAYEACQNTTGAQTAVNINGSVAWAVFASAESTAGSDWARISGIFSVNEDSPYSFICLYTRNATSGSVKFRNVLCVDLTQMFGSGNEPTTVAEFEQMFPASYYPYSAPTLKPVQIAGIKSTDANGDALDSVEWPTFTLRVAGAIGDMLYSDHVETRVGVVDLGTLTWTYIEANDYMRGDIGSWNAKASSTNLSTTLQYTDAFTTSDGNRIRFYSTGYTDAAAFKTAMNGVLLFYELATPTTTPISPALPMSYKVEQGGSESIIVPDGEVSASPIITVAEGESAGELVMGALACIAAPDGPVATANHAINTYLTYNGKLWKVTSAIAAGETITPNTNVSETTVMAELIARTA